MNLIIKHLFNLAGELIGRYTVALGVGILFLLFNGVIMSKFMSHLGMAGNIMVYDIGLLMFFEIPIWMFCVKIVGLWHRSVWAEIIIAGVIAVLFAQWRTFDYYFWPHFISPTADPTTKSQMLFWFIFTAMNYLLATHTAALYCWFAWLIKGRKRKRSEAIL